MRMKLDRNQIDGIIFDLDGTMWDCTEGICESWNIILAKHPEIKRDPITMQDLEQCMGLPMYDIAKKLFPKEEEQIRNGLMDELSVFENSYIGEKGGMLYPDLEKTLKALSEKYPLFIVSNCQEGYIEAFLSAHNLGKYFRDIECWGRTRASKGESNRILMERNGLKHPVYVGDTAGDAQSAMDVQIPFIYAAYGFGETAHYDEKIDTISQLLKLLM